LSQVDLVLTSIPVFLLPCPSSKPGTDQVVRVRVQGLRVLSQVDLGQGLRVLFQVDLVPTSILVFLFLCPCLKTGTDQVVWARV
jgi:hypothetical protein